MMVNKNYYFLTIVAVLTIILLSSQIISENKYTKEMSDKIFHFTDRQKHRPETFEKAMEA